jgi:hypothetical protein
MTESVRIDRRMGLAEGFGGKANARAVYECTATIANTFETAAYERWI